jgi:hypothetical protein
MRLPGEKSMNRINRLALSFAAALVLAASPAARSQEAPKAPEEPEVVKTGSVKVTVAVPAKGTLKKATVYAKTQTAAVAAAGQEILIAGVPVGKTAVTVDAMVEEGAKKELKRHLGVAELTVVENEVGAAAVTLVPVPDVDAYCLGCHPNPRDPKTKLKPGQIARDIHSSGREYPERGRDKYLSVNRAFNDKVAKLEKEGKPHSLRMPLEERIVKVGGKNVKKYFYTCETCHTLHQTTPWIRYARAAYRDSSDLCVGCHF